MIVVRGLVALTAPKGLGYLCEAVSQYYMGDAISNRLIKESKYLLSPQYSSRFGPTDPT
jgi:hypothetical protein